MMLQLNPPLPVEVKDFGKGFAYILIDYSQEHDLYWVVFFDESRVCVVVSNKDIRIQNNYSMGRWDPDKPSLASQIKNLRGHNA